MLLSTLKICVFKLEHTNPALFSVIDSIWDPSKIKLHPSSQQSQEPFETSTSKPVDFCYILTVSMGNITEVHKTSDLYTVGLTITLNSILKEKTSESRRICFWCYLLHVLHDKITDEIILYLVDNKLDNTAPYVKVHMNSVCSSHTLVRILEKGSFLHVKHAWLKEKGFTLLDGFSFVSEEPKPDKRVNLYENLIDWHPAVIKNDIIQITGLIEDVDEEDSCSWPTCLICKSDRITLNENERLAYCDDCKAYVATSTIYQLAIYLSLGKENLVKVQLDQSTIESILPGKRDGFYDIQMVLGLEIRSMICIVMSTQPILTSSGKICACSLEEIETCKKSLTVGAK
ncbi:DNA repair-scaffolding protein-like [Tubulanus polymorphus]|uniref:DNA repair-scaffolding protein-like n=1 Tax=Tubulanus polymorphus TaxID=672921 RepID=UPI003DA4F791